MMLTESGSSLGTFCDCPRKYEFAYIKKLSPRGYSTPLGYGSFVHAFVEEHFTGRSVAGPLREDYKKLFPDFIQNIICDYSMAENVVRMWAHYWGEHRGDLSNTSMKVKAAESEWRFEVTNGDRMVGKSDAIVNHRTYPGHFLYELKTSGDPAREAYKHKLELDKQVSANLIAMHNNGLMPRGVIYDVIWKPPLRRSKAEKFGGEEPIGAFHERILDAYKKEPQRYFERLMVFRSAGDLSDYGLDLSAQFIALRGAHERNYFYRNTNTCEKYGKLCPYFNLCLDPKAAEVEQSYRKRDRKLPELSKGIQE